MKRILFITIFQLLVLKGFSQEKFIFNNDGLTSHLVIEIPNVNQQELYEKAINWIKESYKNPDEVIKAKIENEKLRFEGVKKAVLVSKSFGITEYDDVRYTIELSFKEGKYKFAPTFLASETDLFQYFPSGWQEIKLNGGSYIYKKSGKIKSTFKLYPKNIEDLFEGLNNSLHDYLLKKNHLKKDAEDNW